MLEDAGVAGSSLGWEALALRKMHMERLARWRDALDSCPLPSLLPMYCKYFVVSARCVDAVDLEARLEMVPWRLAGFEAS